MNAPVEEWRVIADFPAYAVSNLGRVKRVVADQKGRLSGDPLRATFDTYGYYQVNLFVDAKAHTKKVHTLVCEAFHGPQPSPRHEVAHGDGDRQNNYCRNLRWATAKENAQDRDTHGTTARGERHWSRTRPESLRRGSQHWSALRPNSTTRGEQVGSAKLTEDDVRAIRSDPRSGVAIAPQYGVSFSTISHIRRGKTWRHVA